MEPYGEFIMWLDIWGFQGYKKGFVIKIKYIFIKIQKSAFVGHYVPVGPLEVIRDSNSSSNVSFWLTTSDLGYIILLL